jgi:hypothetical protein
LKLAQYPESVIHIPLELMKNALNPFIRSVPLLFGILLFLLAVARLLLATVWRDNAQMELLLCRNLLICDTDRLLERAREKLLEGGQQQVASAIRDFQEAVRRDPASAYRWCERA